MAEVKQATVRAANLCGSSSTQSTSSSALTEALLSAVPLIFSQQLYPAHKIDMVLLCRESALKKHHHNNLLEEAGDGELVDIRIMISFLSRLARLQLKLECA